MRPLLFLISLLVAFAASARPDSIPGDRIPLIAGCEQYEFDNEKNKECFKQRVVEHVAQNFQYPEAARLRRVQARIHVNFVIEKDGSVGQVEVARKATRKYWLRFWLRKYAKLIDEEGERVVSLLEFEKPAFKDHEPVRMSFTLPINAKLE